MKPSEVMSDKEITLTEVAFAIAMERRPFADKLVEYGALNEKEVAEFHFAVFNGQAENVRYLLDKIYDALEENE